MPPRTPTQRTGIPDSTSRFTRNFLFLLSFYSTSGRIFHNLKSGKMREVLDFHGGQGRNRTTDTRIFSPLLYQLSYLAAAGGAAYYTGPGGPRQGNFGLGN